VCLLRCKILTQAEDKAKDHHLEHTGMFPLKLQRLEHVLLRPLLAAPPPAKAAAGIQQQYMSMMVMGTILSGSGRDCVVCGRASSTRHDAEEGCLRLFEMSDCCSV
jgi:hypothetical protein